MIDFTKYRKQIGILLIVMAAICSVIAVVYHRDSNLAEKDAEPSVQKSTLISSMLNLKTFQTPKARHISTTEGMAE